MFRLITPAIVLITIITSPANGDDPPNCDKELRPQSIIYNSRNNATVFSKELYADVYYDLTTGRIKHYKAWKDRSITDAPVVRTSKDEKLFFTHGKICKEDGSCSRAVDTFPQLNKTSFFFAKTATTTIGIPNAVTTMVYHGRLCQELTCKAQVIYGAFNENNVQLTKEEFDTAERVPVAMTFLEKSGANGARQIMIYDIFFAEMILDDITKRPPKLDVFKPVNHGWKTAGRWLDCPIDLCFEGDFDAADTIDGTKILLYEGKYQFTINEPGREKTPPAAEISSFFEGGVNYKHRNLDAIATVRSTKEVFLFKDDQVTRIPDLKRRRAAVKLDTIFHDLKGKGNVDGAFSHSGHLLIVIGNDRHVFNVNDNKTIEYKGSDKLNSAYKGMPKAIDAVATSLDDVIFFSGSFVMQTRFGGGTVEIKLMQDNLFACPKYYEENTLTLGINDEKDFRRLQDLRKPVADASTTVAAIWIDVKEIAPTTTAPSQGTGGPGGNNGDSSAVTTILIVVAILVGLAFAAVAAWYFCFKAPSNEAQVTPNPDMPPQAQVTPSEPTSNKAVPSLPTNDVPRDNATDATATMA